MKQYPYVENGMVHVCAWCHPHRSVFIAFPDLPKLPLSHGICAKHRAACLEQMRASLTLPAAHYGGQIK